MNYSNISEKNVREGWDQLFRQMHEQGDDDLIIPHMFIEEQEVEAGKSEHEQKNDE